jgi:hypothetical protein
MWVRTADFKFFSWIINSKLHLKIQFLPQRKHNASPLQSSIEASIPKKKDKSKKSRFWAVDTTGYKFIQYTVWPKEILQKGAYIEEKREENMWFLTRTAHVSGNCFRKMHMFQALVCKMEGDTGHAPYRKQEINFHAICTNKSLVNETVNFLAEATPIKLR